jgi:hypothetical protein
MVLSSGKQDSMWGLTVKWIQIASRIVLLFGCGGLLTLLSGFYVKEPEAMFVDVVPLEHKSLHFGFPFPIFVSYAELWSPDTLAFDAQFVWVGALLDVLLYTFIVGMGYLIGSAIVRDRAKS